MHNAFQGRGSHPGFCVTIQTFMRPDAAAHHGLGSQGRASNSYPAEAWRDWAHSLRATKDRLLCDAAAEDLVLVGFLRVHASALAAGLWL